MTFPPEVWDGVLRHLAGELPPHQIDVWLRPLVPAAADASICANPESATPRVSLRCPGAFHRERVRERFLSPLREAWRHVLGQPVEVRLELEGSPPGGDEPGPVAARMAGASPAPPARRVAPPETGSQARSPSALQPVPERGERPEAPREARPRAARVATTQRERAVEMTATVPKLQQVLPSFENFVVGPCNALAREASFAIASKAPLGLNQLYLCGGSGLGKTHLARAVIRQARTIGSTRPLYLSAETFTSEFMAALRRKDLPAFKHRLRKDCDLLVVEDVAFFEGKTQTQLEFFHTVRHLLEVGGRVVVTGSRLPRELDGLDDCVRQQLCGGFVAEMDCPDPEVRREILRSKAAGGGVHVPQECLDLLVEEVRGNVRELEGVLIQLVTTASLLKQPIDLPLTREAVAKKCGPALARALRPTPEQIIRVVAGFFKTAPEVLAGRSRRRDISQPRQLAMYLCHRYCDASLSEIGRALDRDHPSVKHAVARVEREILERAPLRYQVEALAGQIDRVLCGSRG